MTIKELSSKRFRNFLVSMNRSDMTSKCSEFHIKKTVGNCSSQLRVSIYLNDYGNFTLLSTGAHPDGGH